MEALSAFLNFAKNYPQFVFLLSLVILLLVYLVARRIASGILTHNAECERNLANRAEDIRKKERALREKEESLQKGLSDLAHQKLELDRREKATSVYLSEKESSHHLANENEALQQQYRSLRADLLQRYWLKLDSLKKEYAQRYLREEKLRSFSPLLPPIFNPLFSPDLSPELAQRVLSAVSENISVVTTPECHALVQGESGSRYHTSLEKCDCMDFQMRGGPCKHMIFLLFTLSSPSFSQLSISNMKTSVELSRQKADLEKKYAAKRESIQSQLIDLKKENKALKDEISAHQTNLNLLLDSNLTSMPWLSGMIADYLTYDLELKAKSLDWGHDVKRLKKVESIREIRADAKARIQEAKQAVYQLEYLKALYPGLEDVLDTDFKDLGRPARIPEHDPTRDYLSPEEWNSLSSVEKDQLALDRYINSRNKSNWQIGRDYELSTAYECLQHGYTVDTFGSRKGLDDLGRDLIATKLGQTLIIQCKYWSKQKTIHEKHLFQLYGTLILYRIDHPNLLCSSTAVFVTNTKLSEKAREVADLLDIVVVENHEITEFPRIKCNIGKDADGATYIYHLPMDDQYDVVQIKSPGEFYAFTVQEALDAGFRRAYKWRGN